MHSYSEDVPRDKCSKLWSALISPRPVFLVVSQSLTGHFNIAAFSSIALISIYPPLISISFGKRHGIRKNTLANITSNDQFSINVVPRLLAEIANKSAEGTEIADDFERLTLSSRSFEKSTAVGIAESPVSIACTFQTIVELDAATTTLIIARCSEIYVDDHYMADGLFDPLSADLIGSVGLEDFITVKGESFTLPRTWE